jgi:hypothetical protein
MYRPVVMSRLSQVAPTRNQELMRWAKAPKSCPRRAGRSRRWWGRETGPVGGWCGCAPSPRPPGGLPHGTPGAGWAGSAGGGMACCARGAARSGVARSRRWRFGPAPRGRGTEHFRSGPPVRRRLALAPGDTTPQLIRHPMTRDGGGEAARSALTRKRSRRELHDRAARATLRARRPGRQGHSSCEQLRSTGRP